MSHLLSGLEREAGAVGDDGGEDGLEAEGEEGVEPEHEAVAAGADVAGDLETGMAHGDIIYGGPGVRNDDWSATLNLLLFLFSGGSLYTNQRRQRRRPHTLLFLLSFA